jgi:hypothetical protein
VIPFTDTHLRGLLQGWVGHDNAGRPHMALGPGIPLPLLAQLDRYLDRLEGRTGLKANRGMIARRALELFLVSHASDDAPGGEG